MKKILLISAMLVMSGGAFASHYVNGYYRSTGTYVMPHTSRDPGEASGYYIY